MTVKVAKRDEDFVDYPRLRQFGGQLDYERHEFGKTPTEADAEYVGLLRALAVRALARAEIPRTKLWGIHNEEYQIELPKPQPAISRELQGQLTGPVKFFAKLLEVWGLDENDGARLLGSEYVSHVRDLLSGVSSLRTRDAKDRVRYLLEIRATLDQLFRDPTVEQDWLREPRPELGGDSPMALLLEGSMENMLLVKQFVERISGR